MATLFKVTHHNNALLGIARMGDAPQNEVHYKTDAKEYAWFEARPDNWLQDFRKIVRRLCKSAGHCGRFAIITDEDSGITVERL